MNRNRAGLILLLLLLSMPVHAQDYDSDIDDSDGPASSELFLRFDKQGAAAVHLNVVERPDRWETIRKSLATGLHCPEQRFRPPALNGHNSQSLNHWPAGMRENYVRALADYNSRQLMANCDSVLQWTGSGRDGSLDLAPLVSTLKASGSQQLWVYISFPSAGHVDYTPQNLSSTTRGSLQSLTYRIPLSGPLPQLIHLSYGTTRKALCGGIAISIGFILFPVAVTLWMRRTALVLGKHDPTAAWFSYFRTINWCIKGTMLLWITSGLGARQTIQEWFSFAFAAGWETTLLDIAVVIGPAFGIYFACISLSYPLHLHLRGTKWTRQEFLLQQLINTGVQALPLMFFVAAIESIANNPTAAAGFFLLALLSWMSLRSLQMRVSNSYPHALTTGELRDRVFAIANKARVKVTQIFVLPTGKSQVANAYASGNQTVMFTDYLLQHLTKREVEAVAAHEIAHLQLGHVKKRALIFFAALMLPGLLGMSLQGFFEDGSWIPSMRVGLAAHLYSGIAWFWHWSQRDFVLVLTALMLFYLLSRRHEFAADARAVGLTGDAEAQITGLLKLSRLNLMPIQWGKATGSWLTHPSMVRRAERIAAAAAMPPEQLWGILDRYHTELKSGVSDTAPSLDDHYSVPEASNPENLLSAASKQESHQLRLWTLLVMHLVPSAAAAAFVQTQGVQGNTALLWYLAGAIATPIACIIVSARLGLAGRRAQRTRLAHRLEREGLLLSENSIAVGFSPGALVRFYGLNYYNWDIGFLALSGDRLSYLGEQVRFSLTTQEIEGVCLGQGGPSWWKFPRIYVRFKQVDGRPFVFSIASMEPSSIWKVRRQATRLFERLQDFRTLSAERVPSRTPELPSLAVGDITSRSPREFGGLKTNVQLFMYLLPLAVVVNALLRTDAIWYLLGTAVLTRLIESIPHARFRDRVLRFEAESPDKAAAAKGSA